MTPVSLRSMPPLLVTRKPPSAVGVAPLAPPSVSANNSRRPASGQIRHRQPPVTLVTTSVWSRSHHTGPSPNSMPSTTTSARTDGKLTVSGRSDLAAARARQVVHEHQLTRRSRRGEMRLHERPQVVEGGGVGVAGGDHPGHDALAPFGVWPSADGDLTDAGISTQHPLDRRGPHVLAARDDEVGQPAVHA